MKKLMIFLISILATLVLLTSCMQKKGWVDTVKGKTFYSNGAAMIFDNKANMKFDLVDTDNNYNNASNSSDGSINEQTIISLFESMDFIFVNSPQQNKAVYQINAAGQKLYQGFSTDGKNIYSYGDVADDPKYIDWSIENPNIYSLK